MNRPLKFRAWDNEKKIWLDKTDFCIYKGGAQEVEIGGTEYLYNGASYNPLKFVENDIGGLYFNRNLIIQQYTGLKDKNGVEICEGDIIQLEGSSYKYEVVWNKWQWGIDSKGVVTDFIQGFTSAVENRAIVIGNIFENPELLK